jgi:uncharacterized protein YukE
MSGNYLAVDTDALAKAAPEVQRLASRVKTMNSVLSSTLSKLGDCWGNDQNGRQFAKNYVYSKNQLVEGLDAASKVLDSMAEGITTMSKGFRKTEDEAVDTAGSFKKENPQHP